MKPVDVRWRRGVWTIAYRAADFSLLRIAAAGAVGGEGEVPAPSSFGTLCICCDAERPEPHRFDPSNDNTEADVMTLPVCAACKDHFPRSMRGSSFELYVALTGAALTIYPWVVEGKSDDAFRWKLTYVGLAMVTIPLAILSFLRARTALRARRGHFTHFEVAVRLGQRVVRTNNDRLGKLLSER